MAVTEKQLQEATRDLIQGLANFASTSVVICDWTILDVPSIEGPFVNILIADDFESYQDVVTEQDNYTMPLCLIEPMTGRDWHDAMVSFRDHRQTIRDLFNVEGSTNRSLGFDGVDVLRVFNLSELYYIYPLNVDPEVETESIPESIAQFIGLEITQF